MASVSDLLNKGFWSFLIGFSMASFSVFGQKFSLDLQNSFGFPWCPFTAFTVLLPALFSAVFSILFRQIWVDDAAVKQTASVFISIGMAVASSFLTALAIRPLTASPSPVAAYQQAHNSESVEIPERKLHSNQDVSLPVDEMNGSQL